MRSSAQPTPESAPSRQPVIATAPDLSLHFLPPDQIDPAILEAIEALVVAGGAVGPQWVGYHLRRAHLVSFALDGQTVAGSVTLKNPRPEYIARLRQRCGLDLRGYLERGYTSVAPAYRGRGLATRLVRGLVERAQDWPIYTVIALDNPRALGVTNHAGTRMVASFHSEIRNKTIGIWLQGPLPPWPGENESS
ncbi:MAG: GNAT family N-acetyltransferase [Desulfarculus sp.]|nr:GNAT family N-acetyltransferase [Desulfarculus sp.]